MTTPAWQAPLNGLPGNQRANLGSAHLNQLLSAHPQQQIFPGATAAVPGANNGFFWWSMGNQDYAQRFPLATATTIGRVTVPVEPFGNGCDLLVSLCPDSSGLPNMAAPIAQTKVPAGIINAVAATNGLTAGGPLATPVTNTLTYTNYLTVNNWTSPAASVNGVPSFYTPATYGNWLALIAGFDVTAGTAVANTTVTQYLGGGTMSLPVPQPSLPVAAYYGQAAITSDTVVYAGGIVSSSPTTKVWSAGFNSATGAISSWSAQTALPASVNQGAAAAWNNVVYIIGGTTTGSISGAVNTVYMATASNGQLSTWKTTTPLPVALGYTFAGVVGNWLIVAGGLNASNTVVGTTYYAAILADGSLGPWQTGPTMPVPVYTFTPQWSTATTDSALIAAGGGINTSGGESQYYQTLTFTADGPALTWQSNANYSGILNLPTGAFNDGAGQWHLEMMNQNNTYYSQQVLPMPMLSVPLGASGLTAGGTFYWIVLQAFQNADASDGLNLGLNYQSYVGDGIQTPRHKALWGPVAGSYSVPVTVFDASVSGGPMLHTLEDLNTATAGTAVWSRWSTLLYNGRKALKGVTEVTMQSAGPLNSNSTFTSGVSPWTATNGTITQSSAQVHGGYAFSGLLTPTGGFTSAYASTELIPVTQTLWGSAEWLLATGWFYTPTTWSNFQLNVAWYDQGQNLLSTSTVTVPLTGATWTQASLYAQPSATAAYAAIQPTLTGSPGAGNTLFMSNVRAVLAPEAVPAIASAASVNYPSGAYWPPTGVSQLS